MKTIGMLGGMSWESSADYYRIVNELVKDRLGGLHSAKVMLCSVDFAEIEKLQHQDKWEEAGLLLSQKAKDIEKGGADFLMICTNTMHKLADEIESAISIPLLHIADATAEKIKAHGLRRIGLLGTQFTMEQGFYKGRLEDQFGFDVMVPNEVDRKTVHSIIYSELCMGKVLKKSKSAFLHIIDKLIQQGAEGIILGCTEIGMLVNSEDVLVPVFDTTRIHAEAAVEMALRDAELLR